MIGGDCAAEGGYFCRVLIEKGAGPVDYGIVLDLAGLLLGSLDWGGSM